MSAAFDRLEVADARSFVDGDTVVTTCRLITRSRATGDTLDLPMSQTVRVREDRIVEFRPFYWNVPAYRAVVKPSGPSQQPRRARPRSTEPATAAAHGSRPGG